METQVSLYAMKVIIAIMFTFFSALPLNAQLQEDKVLHFAAGAASGFIGAKIADKISNKDPNWRIIGAFTSSLLVGLAKEAYDEHKYKGWDNDDLAVTALGGVTVGITINIFSGKRNKKKTLSSWNGIGFNQSPLRVVSCHISD